jgi:3-dehydroquinate synthase
MVIFIVGMPASGKTTVGRKLAKSLNMSFIDTDEEFERIYLLNAHTFITEGEGEDKFRKLEKRMILDIAKRDNLVVSTGGGSVLSKSNRDIFHKNYTFYLREDNEVLKDRIEDTNNAFKDIDEIWNQRKTYYEEFENLILDADEYPILLGKNIYPIINKVKNITHFVSDFFKNKNIDLVNKESYVKSGEGLKTFDNLKKYYKKLIALDRDRYSPISSVGGGSMGDFFGMLSGTFMRGIPFYMVPTTLLSMVDSSVGGKVGVNFGKIKNVIGMTNDPQLVIIDINFLDTLSERELYSGMNEVIKCGFLRDESLFNYEVIDKKTMIDVIYKSLKVKLHYVKIDYKDFGDRRYLNFGHTIGHAIELLTNIKHGEAVGYGMFCEVYLSYLTGILSKEKFHYCIKLLSLNMGGLPKVKVNYKDVIKMLNYDKKKVGGTVNFTLLKDITDPVIYDKVEEWQIKEAIFKYVDPTNL